MLVMYRRIYKEALRQKEAIRRSSVPSQQHLIVDSDSVRSRFQALQANGFRSVANTKSAKIKAPLLPLVPPQPVSIAPPSIIMTSSTSAAEGLSSKIDLPQQCETKFNDPKSIQVPPVPPAANIVGTLAATTSGPVICSIIDNSATSASSSPARNALTPTAALLGTVQRRLSLANSNLSEGKHKNGGSSL